MKNFCKKITSLICIFSVLFSFYSINSSAIITSGECGDEVVWSYDGYDTLTISGKGEMEFHIYDDNWFAYSNKIRNLIIKEGITDLCEGAFDYHKNLKNVSLPNSLLHIGDEAFLDCEKLNSISIPDSVTSIGKDAFKGTAYYSDGSNWNNGVLYIGKFLIKANEFEIPENYQIKNGTKIIADNAFEDCVKLVEVSIPNTVTDIGKYAFHECECLSSIIIPNSVKHIEDFAFQYCWNAETVIMGNSVVSIGYQAFNNVGFCNNDKNWEQGVLYLGKFLIAANPDEIPDNYDIKQGTVCIETGAFADCIFLRNITIPESVKTIESSAFFGCSSLYSVNIPNSINTISYSTFNNCTSLTYVTIPLSVKTIESSAFENCSSLTSILIPDSVTKIERCAFWNAGLKTLIIPESISTLEEYSFCADLDYVVIPSTVTAMNQNSFNSGMKWIYFDGSETSWIYMDGYLKYGLYDTHIYCKDTIIVLPEHAKFSNSDFVTCSNFTPKDIFGDATECIKVEDVKGQILNDSDVIGTGMTLVLPNNREYTLVAKGDVDGEDGISASDARLALRRSVSLESFSTDSASYKAADIDKDGNLTAADARLILRASVNLENFYDWVK